jgi:hypothetical protein
VPITAVEVNLVPGMPTILTAGRPLTKFVLAVYLNAVRDAEIWAAAGRSDPGPPGAHESAPRNRIRLLSAAGDPSTPPSSLASITPQRITVVAAIDQLAMATHNGLLAGLSPEGAAALKARIQEVKKHMKIIPHPKCSAHAFLFPLITTYHGRWR